MYRWRRLAAIVALLAAGCAGPAAGGGAPPPANPEVILATTTSTQDSGLLDVLLPRFAQETGYRVKPIAAGSGQAMALGERGEADVLLVHAPESEARFMAAGHGIDRRLVMHNDFILLGPPDDPAGVKGSASAASALQRLAQDARSLFVSRGDSSGTHQLEQGLWKEAGLDPRGKRWYQETGQGMGATLHIASEKRAYTLSDRATYLANRKLLGLAVLLEGDPALLNVYHVVLVNPRKSDRINAEGARAFAAFLVGPVAQGIISDFGRERFGQALFVPDAGKPEPLEGTGGR